MKAVVVEIIIPAALAMWAGTWFVRTFLHDPPDYAFMFFCLVLAFLREERIFARRNFR